MNRDIEILNTVEAIFRKPKLYTPNGTLNEIVSYLLGYRQANALEWQVGNHKNDSVFLALEWLLEEMEIQTSIFLLDPASFTYALTEHFEDNEEISIFLGKKINDAKKKSV